MPQTKVDQSKLTKITDDFFILKDEFLGEGAFGKVYKGWWKSKNKIIAVKIIKASNYDETEIQTLKILSTLVHPNIMGFYGYEFKNDYVYMFVEFCPNGDLTKAIKEGLSQLQVLKYFRQMVQGMCYMNAKKKMHRDLKPDNILIGPEKDLKISDFGLAGQTQNIMITGQKGTALYAAPQVFLTSVFSTQKSEKYTQKCDVWAGGAILYEMLKGQKLFGHIDTYRQLTEQWAKFEKGQKRVNYNNKQLHPLWEYFTNIMLTYDPKKRPTYHEVLQILKKVYNQMQKQITTKTTSGSKNPKLIKVQNYLNFQSQKYAILTGISQNFAQIDFPIKPSVQHTVVFLCLAKYLTHMKKLIRDLKHKNINLPDSDEDIIEDENKDFEIILCMDKYRNIIDNSYTFYNNRLKGNIVEKLLKEYISKPEQQSFFSEFKQVVGLIKDIPEGFFDVEDTYSEKLTQIVNSTFFKVDQSKLTQLKDENLKLYARILLAANLNLILPKQKYQNQNFIKNHLEKINSGKQNDLLAQIKSLSSSLS